MITKTVGNSLLMDYAAGSLSEPVALAVATHLALNPSLQVSYQQINAVGGALLDSIDAEDEIDEDGLESLMARLDDMESDPIRVERDHDEDTLAKIPAPLRTYLGKSLDDLAWKRVTAGVEEFRLPLSGSDFKASLLRVSPGRRMPKHTHRGIEYTVVLDGSYDDGTLCMEAGDFCEADPGDLHQPVADSDTGCLCLIVLDAPVKLTGLMGRIINPFLRH